MENETNNQNKNKSKINPKILWQKFQALDRNKKTVIISASVGILLVIVGLIWYYVIRQEPKTPPIQKTVKKQEPPKPATVVSPLTGVKVTEEQAKLPTTGVMIENSPDARPQSGLYDAGVVFEAIAEGGITRFLAIFQESMPTKIGPVRSVRPYYLDFLKPFDAPLAHAGGSPQGLSELHSQGFKDLEALSSANSNYFYRDPNRYAPHNMYTSREKLLELQKTKGWDTSKFTSFARKEEKKSPEPNAKSIDFNISGYNYNPHFDYDASTNSYPRSMQGQPHNDEAAQKQINPKVVVALVMSHNYAGIYSVYGVSGSGTAYVFQDGKVKEATWHKADRNTQLSLTDKEGKSVKLNPGQTWLSLVSSPGAVTYNP